MALLPEDLNFVLMPFLAPGHSIPMIDMAKSLAKHGVNVTLILTPLVAARSRSVIDRAFASGLSIRLWELKFPCDEFGLPPGCESADVLPSYNLIRNFFLAINGLQEPFEQVLKELQPRPSCVICDKHIPWTAETCTKLQIPRIIFDGMNCFAQVLTHIMYTTKIHETVPPTEPFTVSGLPDEIEFTKVQLPGLLNPAGFKNITDIREQVWETESMAYGAAVNSFEELEGSYVDEYRKLKGFKVWCIGPLSLCSDDNLDRAQRGEQASKDSEQCLKWLDGKKPGSVVYCCLGSLSRLSLTQFIELALGLEESAHPFILVIKGGDISAEIEKWTSDEGFEERNKGKAFVLRGWAPQVLILSHDAVGGFLTHCGWNSTLEGISAGLPMITWPLFGEQFFNEKLVVQIVKTGVRVGAKTASKLGDQENCEAEVVRQDIKEAVLSVMDEGKEANDRRKRAQELGEMAKKSVEAGGSSYLNTRELINEIAELW